MTKAGGKIKRGTAPRSGNEREMQELVDKLSKIVGEGAEGEKCKSQLQPFLKSLLAADDEKEAAAQTKIEKEHLPIARNLTAVPLIVFLLAASSYDAAYGLQRSSRMQLYLDYSFFGYCCMCIICASRSWISAEVLYYMSALGSILGVAHTFLSEPPSILITAPLKQMLTLSSASILLDGSLAIFSSLVSNVADIAQLLQFECQRGLLPGMVMTELGVTFMAVIPIVLLKECLLKEPEPSTDGEVQLFFHEHSAARRMLAVLCDAQVYLDQDLSIISHCKGLAQLLMSNSSSKALEGRTFQDFLAPRDKPRFKTFVESAVKARHGRGRSVACGPSQGKGRFLRDETMTSLEAEELGREGCEPERLASSSWKHKPGAPSAGGFDSLEFEPIMFQLPFRMKNSCALVANNVDLSFAKERSSPSLRPGGAGEEEGVAEEDVLVRLKLSCFMVKKMTPSKPQKIKELEERAKAQADLVKNSSFSSALGDGPRQGAPLKKSSKAPSLSDRSDVLEPIQEVRNLTRRARR
ncbi:unnamed protein product [Effrenium voratum]|nr:unnamed protein product [Effrenium voratum]